MGLKGGNNGDWRKLLEGWNQTIVGLKAGAPRHSTPFMVLLESDHCGIESRPVFLLHLYFNELESDHCGIESKAQLGVGTAITVLESDHCGIERDELGYKRLYL